MKKPIFHALVKRKFFIALLFLFNAFAGNAQWTYTITVKQTGRCIPFPTHGSIPFYTKSACEADRQGNLSYSGSDWSFGDGSCTTIITCTPCVGSDIDDSGKGSTSGQGGSPNQTNPGDVSNQGPMNGNPFFSSHPSMSFEEWAAEFKQILATLGINSIIGKNYTLPRIPMGKDKYSNAAYAIKAMTYEPKTKPVSSSNASIQDASSVDLRGKKGLVDPDNQSGNTNNTVPLLNSPADTRSLRASVVPLPVPGEIREDPKHENIDLAREHLVSLVGIIAPGALGYVSIATVNIWAENAKAIKDIWDGNDCPSSSTILVNALKQTAIDEAMQGLGSLGGSASGKLFAGIADRSMIKKGVLPGIEGVVKEGRIAEIGEAHYKIVSVGVNAGLKIMNAWGISTAFDSPK